MRLLDRLISIEEHLNNLVVVVMSGEDERGDVWGELTFLVGSKERILHRLLALFGTRHVVRMFDDHLRVKLVVSCLAFTIFKELMEIEYH